ncbi:MAG: hypothetical protein K2F81_02185 [Ruminococcus sp.]|nr:hypothetical protein [Ruminococcus sp.]
MTKRTKIVLISAVTLILCLTAFLIFHFFFNKSNDNKVINKYEFIENETNMFMSDVVGNSGDFVYFDDYVTSSYYEYDTVKEKRIKMPVEGLIAHYNFYNGDLYCVHADSNNKLSIVKWDINTGDYETIYTPPNGVEGLYHFAMTTDGLMFFLERKPSSEVAIGKSVEDEDGYIINYTLYIYNPKTNEKTAVVDGVDRYYVSGNRLYFDKVHFLKQTEEIFYIDFDKPEEVIDTGICCRTEEAVKNGYDGWFYVDDEYIYYSGGTKNYYRRSIKDNEEELLYTYSDSEGYIGRCIEFNGKQIIYVRCEFDNEVKFGAKLYELDTETKEVKNIWIDTSEELLGDYASFKGNDEYYYLSTHPANRLINEGKILGCHYYLIYANGEKKLMYDNVNEWGVQTIE